MLLRHGGLGPVVRFGARRLLQGLYGLVVAVLCSCRYGRVLGLRSYIYIERGFWDGVVWFRTIVWLLGRPLKNPQTIFALPLLKNKKYKPSR